MEAAREEIQSISPFHSTQKKTFTFLFHFASFREVELKRYYNSKVAGAKIQSNAKKIDERWLKGAEATAPGHSTLFISFLSSLPNGKKEEIKKELKALGALCGI